MNPDDMKQVGLSAGDLVEVYNDNGSTQALRGRHLRPDLVLRCRWDDWVDLVAGREDPARAILRRKLRLRGRPRMLLRMRKIFA